MEFLRATVAPIGAGPLVGGTGSLAHAAVTAYGVLAGDNSPHWRWSTSGGDGESCPGGGHCLWTTCGGWQPPSVRAQRLGGWGVVPRRRSMLVERLPVMAALIDAGPLARGMGRPA